jgi:hypothetical protein
MSEASLQDSVRRGFAPNGAITAIGDGRNMVLSSPDPVAFKTYSPD